MKTVQMTIEIKTGLPNYSARTTTATVVADEGESIDIQTAVRHVDKEIRAAWNPNSGPSDKAVEKGVEKCVEVEKKHVGPPKRTTTKKAKKAAISAPVKEPLSAIDDILG